MDDRILQAAAQRLAQRTMIDEADLDELHAAALGQLEGSTGDYREFVLFLLDTFAAARRQFDGTEGKTMLDTLFAQQSG